MLQVPVVLGVVALVSYLTAESGCGYQGTADSTAKTTYDIAKNEVAKQYFSDSDLSTEIGQCQTTMDAVENSYYSTGNYESVYTRHAFIGLKKDISGSLQYFKSTQFCPVITTYDEYNNDPKIVFCAKLQKASLTTGVLKLLDLDLNIPAEKVLIDAAWGTRAAYPNSYCQYFLDKQQPRREEQYLR